MQQVDEDSQTVPAFTQNNVLPKDQPKFLPKELRPVSVSIC